MRLRSRFWALMGWIINDGPTLREVFWRRRNA